MCHSLAVWTASLVFALLSSFSGVKKGYQGQTDAILFPSQTSIVYCCIFDLFFKTPVERKFMHLSDVLGLFKQKHPGKSGQPTALLQALPAPRALEKPGPLAAAPPSMAPPSLPGRLFLSQTEGQSRGLPVVGRACQNDRPFRWLKYLSSNWVEIWNLNHFLKHALDRWRKIHQQQPNRQTNAPKKIGSFTLTLSTKLQWFLFLGCEQNFETVPFCLVFLFGVELCQITTFPLRAPLNAPKKENAGQLQNDVKTEAGV